MVHRCEVTACSRLSSTCITWCPITSVNTRSSPRTASPWRHGRSSCCDHRPHTPSPPVSKASFTSRLNWNELDRMRWDEMRWNEGYERCLVVHTCLRRLNVRTHNYGTKWFQIILAGILTERGPTVSFQPPEFRPIGLRPNTNSETHLVPRFIQTITLLIEM